MSVLKWIWGLLKKVWIYLAHLVHFIVDIFTSVLSWVIAGVIYVVHLVFQYVGQFYEGLFENLEEISLQGISIPPLATWLARDLLALDVAWECLVIFLVAWFGTRVARLSFSAVRAILDLL